MPKKKPFLQETPSTLRAKVAAFIKLLNSGAREKNEREKFRDWCEVVYCAYAKLSAAAFGDQQRADALEARYMQVVNSYEDKDYIRNAWIGMRELGEDVMEFGGADFLGTIAGQINALAEEQGQFFTPYEVAKLMAQIQLADFEVVVQRDGFLKLSDTAVGAGCLIIAAADAIQQRGGNPMTDLLVEVWDVSYLAYQMCFLQLTWRGVPARVVRGNSLSMKIFETAYTPHTVIFYNAHGRLFGPKKPTIDDAIRAVIALDRAQVAARADADLRVEPREDAPPDLGNLESLTQLLLF